MANLQNDMDLQRILTAIVMKTSCFRPGGAIYGRGASPKAAVLDLCKKFEKRSLNTAIL